MDAHRASDRDAPDPAPGPAPGRARGTRVPALAATLALAGCGDSGASVAGGVEGVGGSGALSIVACSLGCSPDGGGGTVQCAINTVYVNQPLAVEFDKPIDPASVGPLSFRVVSASGSTPSGEYAVDPVNPRRVVFRPLVTFGSDGLPQFGYEPGTPYSVQVPAAVPGQLGFVITAHGGQKNATPLDCDIVPTSEVLDVVPGPPVVTPTIEELDGGGAVYDAFTSPAGVATNARLRLDFNDVMNPATLVNAVTGTSTFIEVVVDLDGDLGDASDQIEIPGEFDIDIEQTAGLERTTVLFTPSAGFPGAGSDADEPRRIVVTLPPTIADLGGNALANAGVLSFTTVVQPAQVEVLAATFAVDETKLDARRTSMLRDAPFAGTAPDGGAVEGRLLRGLGGGSGRLGDLLVPSGGEVVLSTGPDVPTVFGPDLTTGPVFDDGGTPAPADDVLVAYHVRASIVDEGSYPADWATDGIDGDGPGETTATVTDGIFEFASLVLEPGARLRLVGGQPARLFVRGDAEIRGAVLAQGGAAPAHGATTPFGGEAGAAGPGAGAGGRGADRPIVSPDLIAIGGYAHEPGAVVAIDGAPGAGRGGAVPVGGDDFGAGVGGQHFPAVFPGPALTDFGDFEPNSTCQSVQVGVPGGGGSYAVAGGLPDYSTPLAFAGIPAPPVLPPPSDDLAGAAEIVLDPDAGGALIGGSGGGGGGAGLAYTKTNGNPLTGCATAVFGELELFTYRDASAAGGGGGGGAVQLQVGHRLDLQAPIVVDGGIGGGLGLGGWAEGASMAPGGGGSGGALLLQVFEADIAPYTGLLDVSGGEGGFNFGTGSRGGRGAPGVVQIQGSAYLDRLLPDAVAVDLPLDAAAIAATIEPEPSFEPDAELPAERILALGDWQSTTVGPGATVGFQTCWLTPSPGSFEAEFLADDGGAPGWDLVVELSGASGTSAGELVSYRGDPGSLGALTGGLSLAEFFGNTLGTSTCGCVGSPLVVRFQGVRLLGAVPDACQVPLDGDGSVALDGSLTPWLGSPVELSEYWTDVLGEGSGLAAQRRPNAVRAQVLIAGDDPLAAVLESVVEVTVRVETD